MTNRMRIACVASLLVVAVALRVWSFQWNDRLQGDVNLFALTARSFVQSGSLSYPMKYEFSDRVDYCAERSAASQHPPLFPLIAGLAGTAFETDDTYPLLKLLSELGGLAVLALVATFSAEPGGLVALALVATSPMLVDFSGNGSPYAWSGFLLLLSTILVGRLRAARVRDAVLAGCIAGIAPQIHSALLAVPASFIVLWLAKGRQNTLRSWLAFVGGAAVVAAPWLLWNQHHFGSPLYSYSPHHLWTDLGAAQEGIYGDTVTWRWVATDWVQVVWNVLRTTFWSALDLLRGLLRDGGPGALALATVALVAVPVTVGRRGLELALPVLFYLALVLPFQFRDRFVVPLLPVFYVLVGQGLTNAWRPGGRWFAVLCAATSLAWMAAAFFESPPTRYYAGAAQHREWYTAMVPVARQLARLGPGSVLAASSTLDGGIEAAYYHRRHVIRGQAHGRWHEERPGDVLRKLAQDFHARYLWADRFTLSDLQTVFPDARIALGNGSYFVLELSGQGAAPRGMCDTDRGRGETSGRAP